jgi:hypothetical protein
MSGVAGRVGRERELSHHHLESRYRLMYMGIHLMYAAIDLMYVGVPLMYAAIDLMYAGVPLMYVAIDLHVRGLSPDVRGRSLKYEVGPVIFHKFGGRTKAPRRRSAGDSGGRVPDAPAPLPHALEDPDPHGLLGFVASPSQGDPDEVVVVVEVKGGGSEGAGAGRERAGGGSERAADRDGRGAESRLPI